MDMDTDPPSAQSGDEPGDMSTSQADSSRTPPAPGLTRAGAAWVATALALVLLILLIVFILQNPTRVEIQFLGVSGTIPLGMALLVASVAGGVVVAIAGVARVTQLRMSARHTRQRTSGP